MLGLAITLLILNIILMLFFYFKLSKKFSNANLIREIRKDAERLVADIAYQTDKSVTVIESKIKEAKLTMQELERRIVLSETEVEKKKHQAEILKELKENVKTEVLKEIPVKEVPSKEPPVPPEPPVPKVPAKKAKAQKKPKENTDEPSLFNEHTGEPVKIYTKQILLNSKNKVGVPEESLHEQIIEMARKGFSIELIAEKVPLPIGEIELIISMHG